MYKLIFLGTILLTASIDSNAQKTASCEKITSEALINTDNVAGVCNELNLSEKEKKQLQSKWQKIAKSKIREMNDQFKDPDSVKLKNVRISESGLVICGEANAKNSYGGYTGYKSFYYTWMIATLRLDDSDSFSRERFKTDCLSGNIILVKQ